MCKSCISLYTTSFMFAWTYLFVWFPQPQITYFSPSHHHHPYLKHVHIIAIYFFGPLLLSLLFLTAALIRHKTVYPLISHHRHPSNHCHLCPMHMPVHFLFSMTSHFHVIYNSIRMHHKPFLATTRKHLWQ